MVIRSMFAITILLGIGIPNTAQSRTLNVCKTGCTFTSIQAAINAARRGDVVLVDDGTYLEKINFKGKSITVRSKNGAAATVIDGNNENTAVRFESGETRRSVIDGFTITRGYDGLDGGGVCCRNSSPTITRCVIVGNSGSNGGGINCIAASPAISKCLISGNIASNGGGIGCDESASPTVTNCTISGNFGFYGGGIGFAGNASPTVTNCTISGNLSDHGGAIKGQGGHIRVVNSILWGNDATFPGTEEIYLDGESSISVSYSDVSGGWEGIGNVNADPIFTDPRPPAEAPAVGGDYHLEAGSPCIDTGTGATRRYPKLPSDDIDGDPRPQGEEYDIGSDELEQSASGILVK